MLVHKCFFQIPTDFFAHNKIPASAIHLFYAESRKGNLPSITLFPCIIMFFKEDLYKITEPSSKQA